MTKLTDKASRSTIKLLDGTSCGSQPFILKLSAHVVCPKLELAVCLQLFSCTVLPTAPANGDRSFQAELAGYGEPHLSSCVAERHHSGCTWTSLAVAQIFAGPADAASATLHPQHHPRHAKCAMLRKLVITSQVWSMKQ